MEATTSSMGALRVGFTSEKKNGSKSTGILAAWKLIHFLHYTNRHLYFELRTKNEIVITYH